MPSSEAECGKKNALVFSLSIFFHCTRATHTAKIQNWVASVLPFGACIRFMSLPHIHLLFSRGNYYLHCSKYGAHTKHTYRFLFNWERRKMKSSQRKEKISSLLSLIGSIIVIGVCIHQLQLTHQQKQSDYTGAWMWCTASSEKPLLIPRCRPMNLVPFPQFLHIFNSLWCTRRSNHNVTDQCPLPTAEYGAKIDWIEPRRLEPKVWPIKWPIISTIMNSKWFAAYGRQRSAKTLQIQLHRDDEVIEHRATGKRCKTSISPSFCSSI